MCCPSLVLIEHPEPSSGSSQRNVNLCLDINFRRRAGGCATLLIFCGSIYTGCRSQWPCCLRRRSAAALLLRLLVRTPPGAWMFFCCKCCVLLGKSLCDEPFNRPEEFYRLLCVVVCGLKTSRMRRPWPALGSSIIRKKYINSMALVRERIIPTERPPPVGEVSANFCG
jgi:hypothetical protein